MPLRFEVFGEQHVPAVLAFNQRMTEGHAASDFLLPTAIKTGRTTPDDPIQWTSYVVLDGEFVRGGMLAMDQPGMLNGQEVCATNFQSPLSEGIVDPKYSIVGMQMVKFMQKRADAVFMVGMVRPIVRCPRCWPPQDGQCGPFHSYSACIALGTFCGSCRCCARRL